MIDRLSDTGHATFGQLIDDENRKIAVTLERPWLGNQRSVSCVPPGVYFAHRRFSPKHGYEVFELADVPYRDNIELHIGNLAHRDSLGCILLGNRFGLVDGENGILESRAAFQRFMDIMRGQDTFRLSIIAPHQDAA